MKLTARFTQLTTLFLFVLAFFLTVKFIYQTQAFYYLLLFSVNILGFFAISSVLGRPKVIHAPIWVVLYTILIVYFFQLFVLLYDPRIAGYDIYVDDFVSDPRIVLKYFENVTAGFVSFCIASIMCVFLVRKNPLPTPVVVNYSSSYFYALTVLIVTLSFGSGLLMFLLGTSQIGGEAVALPYRLSGLIFFLRVTLIPSIIIYAIFISENSNRGRYLIFFLVLLFFHGLSDMLLRSSRGFLLQVVILVTFLFILSGRLYASRIRLVGWTIAFTIIAIPLISLTRSIRMEGMTGNFSILEEALSRTVIDPELIFTSISNLIAFMFIRFTGAVSFLQVMGRDPTYVFHRLLEPGFYVTDYMTYDVMEWPIWQSMGYAPSTFGFFYLLGGTFALVIGIFFLICVAMFIWSLLCRLSLRARPVVLAIFLLYFFVTFSDGTWSGVLVQLAGLSLAMIFCELLSRFRI